MLYMYTQYLSVLRFCILKFKPLYQGCYGLHSGKIFKMFYTIKSPETLEPFIALVFITKAGVCADSQASTIMNVDFKHLHYS